MCSVCKKGFMLKENLYRHLIEVHEKQYATIKCDFCIRTFHYQSNPSDHVKGINIPKKKYNCKACGDFVTKSIEQDLTEKEPNVYTGHVVRSSTLDLLKYIKEKV